MWSDGLKDLSKSITSISVLMCSFTELISQRSVSLLTERKNKWWWGKSVVRDAPNIQDDRCSQMLMFSSVSCVMVSKVQITLCEELITALLLSCFKYSPKKRVFFFTLLHDFMAFFHEIHCFLTSAPTSVSYCLQLFMDRKCPKLWA